MKSIFSIMVVAAAAFMVSCAGCAGNAEKSTDPEVIEVVIDTLATVEAKVCECEECTCDTCTCAVVAETVAETVVETAEVVAE